jgi:hypothetical protein
MDSSQSNNAAHLQHGANPAYNSDFLGGIQGYAHNTDQDDMRQYFHPELFDNQDFDSGLQSEQSVQQSQPQHHNYPNASINQIGTGRMQSPAMPTFNQSQPYSQQPPQYSQPLYDHRNMYAQHAYDPRMFQQRPSHSPSPLDPYGYSAQYAQQTQAGQVNIQPRPTQTSPPQYAARPQTYSPYTTFESNGPTLPQRQDADLMQFANFHRSSQSSAQSFINPSMLDGQGLNGHLPQTQQSQQRQQPQTQQQTHASLYYPTSASTGNQDSGQAIHQILPHGMPVNQIQGKQF